jgi:hypothetical protein
VDGKLLPTNVEDAAMQLNLLLKNTLNPIWKFEKLLNQKNDVFSVLKKYACYITGAFRKFMQFLKS